MCDTMHIAGTRQSEYAMAQCLVFGVARWESRLKLSQCIWIEDKNKSTIQTVHLLPWLHVIIYAHVYVNPQKRKEKRENLWTLRAQKLQTHPFPFFSFSWQTSKRNMMTILNVNARRHRQSDLHAQNLCTALILQHLWVQNLKTCAMVRHTRI
jgi:hypothetical protein